MRAPIVFLILNIIFLSGNSASAQTRNQELNLLAENNSRYKNTDKVLHRPMNNPVEITNRMPLNISPAIPLRAPGPDYHLIDDMDQFERFNMIYQFNEFEVRKNNDKVFITWTNGYDQLVEHFEVIRYDEDLKNPTVIHFIDPVAGKSVNSYEVHDQPGGETECYYQLRVYDKTENIVVTEKRKVMNGFHQLVVSPKVTDDEIMLTNINSDHSRSLLKVVDNEGKIVMQINIPKETDHMAINLVDLAAGEYSIQIESKKTSVTTLVTKQ